MAKSKQPVDLDRKQTLKDVYRQNQGHWCFPIRL